MRISISETPGRLEIRERHDLAAAGLEVSVVALRYEAEALSFLRRHCNDTARIEQLRQLLPLGTHMQQQSSAPHVLAQIADRLVSGQLQVVSLDRPAGIMGAGPAAPNATPQIVARRSPVSTTPPLPPPRPQPGTALQPEPLEVEPSDNVEQDAQAATLEAAAVNGTPFCAICPRQTTPPGTARTAG